MIGIEEENAIRILSAHNKWRRGGASHEFSPGEIGWAIDVAIKHFRKSRRRVNKISGLNK